MIVDCPSPNPTYTLTGFGRSYGFTPSDDGLVRVHFSSEGSSGTYILDLEEAHQLWRRLTKSGYRRV